MSKLLQVRAYKSCLPQRHEVCNINVEVTDTVNATEKNVAEIAEGNIDPRQRDV